MSKCFIMIDVMFLMILMLIRHGTACQKVYFIIIIGHFQIKYLRFNQILVLVAMMFRPIQDGHFWGYSRIAGWGQWQGQKALCPYDETWHSYTLSKEDQKNI